MALPRPLRWLLGIVATLLVLAVLAIVVVLSLLSSESGTRWLAGQAQQRLGDALTIDNPGGSILGGLNFDRLVWRGDGSTVTIEHVESDWSLHPLHSIAVRTLHVGRVEVRSTGPSKDEPATPPSSFALPVEISIDSATIDRVEIVSDTRNTVIDDIRARVALGSTDHVELTSAKVQGVSLSGTATIGATAPFALTASIKADSDAWPQFESVTVDAKGSLETLDLTGVLILPAAAKAEPVKLAARIKPFVAWPVAHVEADAPRVPLSTLAAGSPVDAMLSIKVSLDDNGKSGLAGPIEIRNSEPGQVEAGRIPVSIASGHAELDADSVAIDRLQIRLTRDGRGDDGDITGKLDIGFDGRIEADVKVARVDPQAFSRDALPTRIDGSIRAVNQGDKTTATVDLRGQGLLVDGHATLLARELTIEQLVLRIGETAGAGELELHGKLGLDAPRRFEARLDARRFEPALLMKKVAPKQGDLHELRWTDTRLNGRVDARGVLPNPRGDFDVALDFAINGSRFANMQVDANGKSGIERRQGNWRLVDADAAIQFDENRLVWKGGFGGENQTLTAALKAPRLDRLRAIVGQPLRGEFDLDATIAGSIENPVVGSSFQIKGLAIAADLAIEKAAGTASIANQRMAIEAQAGPLRAGGMPFTQATLKGSGTLEDHVIAIGLDGAGAGDAIHSRAELAGAWIPAVAATGRARAAAAHWAGNLKSLTNTGRIDVSLQEPAPLDLSGSRQFFGPARVAVGGGTLVIDSVEHREDGSLQAAGQLKSIPARALSIWLSRLNLPQNTLTVGGNWRVAMGDRVNAHVDLAREQGDLVLGADGAGPLGLERLGVALDVVDNVVKGSFGVTARRLGTLDATLNTSLSKREGNFGIAGDTPFQYKVQGELASLAWLALLVDTPVSADGRIRIDLARDGPLAAPLLKGQVIGSSLVLKSYDPRGELRDGRFRIDIDQDRLVLSDFNFTGRGGGSLTGSGQLSLINESGATATTGPRPPAADGALEFTLDKLDALTDPNYHVVSSGNVKLGFSREAMDVTGSIKADSARITVGDSLAPTLGSDVVVTRGAVDDDTVVKPGTTALPVSVDLKIDLGRNFEVTGFGGDASLRGQMSLVARKGTPLRAVGVITVYKGRYYAYSQSLNVDRGSITFNGPLDDATINFHATRPNLPTDIEVGLEVSGTIREPRIKLVSSPDMSETEKLSWLALGRGLDNASGGDLQLIGIAASALFGGGNSTPLGSKLGSGIGLDQVDVRSDATTQQTIVSVGKRLSDRLLLTFERSVSGTSTLAKLRYEVGRSWYVQTTTGTEQAVDVFYTFSFD